MCPVALVVMSQAESFSPAIAADGSETFGLNEQRMARLREDFAIDLRIGDTISFWSISSVGLSLSIAAVLALLIGAMIPANFGGSTPGQRLLGLRIVSTDGSEAQLSQHLIRTAGLLVDLIPFVLPGLAGWLNARGSCDQQRYGDEWAATMVIDREYRDPTIELITPLAPAGDAVTIESIPTLDVAIVESAPVDRLDVVATSSSSLVTGDNRRVPPAADLPPPLARQYRSYEAMSVADRSDSTAPSPPADGRAATAATLGAEPWWSTEHNAWMVIEPRSGRQFIHDEGGDRWIPAA